ncbi:MAG TPA: AsmA family protein, partial [Candidatus Binatia bacterium]|nr:AsmA family protein [Candidatus Binatia bacterium]
MLPLRTFSLAVRDPADWLCPSSWYTARFVSSLYTNRYLNPQSVIHKTMRKRIIVAVAALLVAVAGLTLLDALVRLNKDFFIGRAERALGRKIAVDNVEVTFWPVGARLANVVVADDPAFSTEDFLRAKTLWVEFRLFSLFLGQFRPKRMALDGPTITVVRDTQGRYNFPRRAEKNGREAAGRSKKSPVEQQDRRFLVLPAFDISSGTLRFRDLTDGSELTATQIDLKTSAFESGEPFEIQLDAAIMAAQPNLHLTSWIGSIGENHDFRDVPLAGEINATDLNLGQVNKALPQFRKSLPKALRFDGIYTIKELKFKGTLNDLSLKGAVTGTDASFRFE